MLFAAAVLLGAPLNSSAQKAKLPRPRVLESGVTLERDPATGELRPRSASEEPPATAVIRAQVSMVAVGCTVIAPDGTRVRGLTADNFEVWENGLEQGVAAFDATESPASIALVLDSSPSIFRELGEVREAARSLTQSLAAQDEVAVVTFANETHLLLPFSRDRALLDAALASPELSHVANSSQSYIYQAVYLTAQELFAGRSGRKAIVLLTDGMDSGLGLTRDPGSMHPRSGPNSPLAFDDVGRALAAQGIELYVISTENRPSVMTEAWLAAHERTPLVTFETLDAGVPPYTLYLAELVRQAGGGLYFLRELGSLAEIYHRIALTLGAEYTLSYYSPEGSAQPGWRQLRVDLRPGSTGAPTGAQLRYRSSYYVPAAR
jgi:VWFA-related protein